MTEASSPYTPIRIERTLAAEPSDVFRMWTEPAFVAAWIWGDLAHETDATVEPRVGGDFRASTGTKDGSRWSLVGTVQDVRPSTRLVCSLAWDAPMGYESDDERVTIELQSAGTGRTQMTFVHDGVPGGVAARTHEAGWSNAFDHLERLLTDRGAIRPSAS